MTLQDRKLGQISTITNKKVVLQRIYWLEVLVCVLLKGVKVGQGNVKK